MRAPSQTDFIKRLAPWIGWYQASVAVQRTREAGWLPAGQRGAPKTLTREQAACVLAVEMLGYSQRYSGRRGAADDLARNRDLIERILGAFVTGADVETRWRTGATVCPVTVVVSLRGDLFRDVGRWLEQIDATSDAMEAAE